MAYFGNKDNLNLIAGLQAAGLQFEVLQKELQSTILEGKTCIISGTFETFSRDEIKDLVELNGGKIGSSVSAKTNYLIAGANMGPSKRTKAETLKVPIISEKEFLQITDNFAQALILEDKVIRKIRKILTPLDAEFQKYCNKLHEREAKHD